MNDLHTHVRPLSVICARGLAPLVAWEIDALRLPAKPAGVNRVLSRGTLQDAMRLNLWLRCAQRVLLEIGGTTAADNADAMYRAASAIAWEALLPVDGRFSITVTVRNPTIRDSRFAALRLKDAIADRMMQRLGRRPDAGPDRSGAAVVHLHWLDRRATFYLDTSGESLSRRGYRLHNVAAPLQEALGAALLYAAGWHPGQALVNPMCGSGTLAIEAALMAGRMAPGLQRDTFAFQFLRGFDAQVWQRLRAEAGRRSHASFPPIVASDRQAGAVDRARANARQAAVASRIAWQVCDFARTRLPPLPGLILLNPEYGERLGSKPALKPTYARLGQFLRARPQGYAAGVLGGDPDLNAALGLKPDRVLRLDNGPIRCEFLFFRAAAPAGSG